MVLEMKMNIEIYWPHSATNNLQTLYSCIFILLQSLGNHSVEMRCVSIHSLETDMAGIPAMNEDTP